MSSCFFIILTMIHHHFSMIIEKLLGILFNVLEVAIRSVLSKKANFKNFAIFTGKHLCWSLSLIKLQAFRKSICERLLLTYVSSNLDFYDYWLQYLIKVDKSLTCSVLSKCNVILRICFSTMKT